MQDWVEVPSTPTKYHKSAPKQIAEPSTALLLEQTFAILYILISGSARAFMSIAILYFEAFWSIISIWTPFLAVKLCLLLYSVTRRRPHHQCKE